MAGSINLSLAQQFDKTSGKLLSGGRLYTFSAGTTTPQNVFKDQALTLAYGNPLELDTAGRIPAFYVADGSVRARLVSKTGVVQFDADNILVVGPSSGGGGGSSVDPTTIFQTGDPLWVPFTGARTGWVRANGRTVGSTTSGATERANSDCQALYLYLWAYPDALCPVTGGRGLTAAADWAANKAIAALDMRGQAPFGLSDMGNSDAATFAGNTFGFGNGTTAAASLGEPTHTLTLPETVAHSHANTLNDPGHVHGTKAHASTSTGGAGPSDPNGVQVGTPTTDSAVTGITITNASAGGGGAHNNMPPARLGTWYLKL